VEGSDEEPQLDEDAEEFECVDMCGGWLGFGLVALFVVVTLSGEGTRVEVGDGESPHVGKV